MATNISSGSVATSSISVSGSVTASSFAGDGSALTGMEGGTIVQIVSSYSDATSSHSNQSTHLNTTINMTDSGNRLLISGVFQGDCGDDNNVFLEYSINGGAFVRDIKLNSRAYTYSGIGEINSSSVSNRGPNALPLDSIFHPNTSGTVEIRVFIDVESTSTFRYNRSYNGADNSENYGTSRSRLILTEVRGL
jgi:hypothetical protein